jgi:glycosyltransferase involved in cell wall biosynthesis
VARRWAENFDGRVKLLCRPRNLGAAANFVSSLAECSGRYVAILEGDDYWLDTDKLRKQHEFLAGNREHSACFHRVQLLLDDGRLVDWTPLQATKPSLEFADVLVQNFVPNCSALMFLNDPPLQLPDWVLQLPYYDWVLHVCNAQRGKLAYIDEVMSVYRIHSRGAWHGKSMKDQVAEVIRILDHLDRYTGGRHEGLIRAHKQIWAQKLGAHSLQQDSQLAILERAQQPLIGSSAAVARAWPARIRAWLKFFA